MNGPYGTLQIRRAETPIHAGYEYRSSGALFVGDKSYISTVLQFDAVNASATDVLMAHNSSVVRLMASADTHVVLDSAQLSPPLRIESRRVSSGAVGWSRWDGASLEVLLLEGEEVVIA